MIELSRRPGDGIKGGSSPGWWKEKEGREEKPEKIVKPTKRHNHALTLDVSDIKETRIQS